MTRFLVLAATAALTIAGAAQPDAERAWAPLAFLVGDWVGEGGGAPGQGTGAFSFQFDLQRKVLVRKSRADYPAAKDRPAFSHEDLTVVYRDAGGELRAVYFDSESHVIHYAVTAPAEGAALLVSDAATPGPRYRLSYTRTGENTVTLKFEIAPPGKPDAFSTYVEAKARRR